jgi:hypothetical protein
MIQKTNLASIGILLSAAVVLGPYSGSRLLSRQNAPAQSADSPAASPQSSTAQPPAAQQQTPVSLGEEPHHHPLLQNDFVNVFSVEVAPRDATWLHKHDLPVLTVTIGAVEFVNAVPGEADAQVRLPDGATRYSPGKFTHAVRTDTGVAFRNVTVEFRRPQDAPRNLCYKVLDAPLNCPPHPLPSNGNSAGPAQDEMPYFETDQLRVELIRVGSDHQYVEENAKQNALLIALSNANLDANFDRRHTPPLHEGDVLWLPAGTRRKVVNSSGSNSSFLLISFKDSAPVTRLE